MCSHVLTCTDRSLLQLIKLLSELKHDNAYRTVVRMQLALKALANESHLTARQVLGHLAKGTSIQDGFPELCKLTAIGLGCVSLRKSHPNFQLYTNK